MIGQHTLAPNPGSRRKSRAIGRGDGSGRGSYSGRGMKGQNARSGGGTKPGFEGGQTPLIRRMPKLKGFKNPNRMDFQVVNVGDLEVLENGSSVDVVSLYEAKLINRKNNPVKVLGSGTLTKKLTIKVDACSESAKEKIVAAGGTVQVKEKASKKESKETPQ